MGKITIKHFLNTRLNPVYALNDVQIYPLYVRITAMRKTTEIVSRAFVYGVEIENYPFPESVQQIFTRSQHSEITTPYLSMDDFEILEKNYFVYLKREEEIIYRIVRQLIDESEYEGKDFSIKHVSRIYDEQHKAVFLILSDYFKRLAQSFFSLGNYENMSYLFNTHLCFDEINRLLQEITRSENGHSDFFEFYMSKADYLIQLDSIFSMFKDSRHISYYDWQRSNMTEKFFSFVDEECEERLEKSVTIIKELFQSAISDYQESCKYSKYYS